MNQGIYKNIKAIIYHRDPCKKPSLNASLAVLMVKKTPFHVFKQHPKLNKYWSYKDDKKFDTGIAAHHLILEDGGNLVELDFDNYRTNKAKEARESILLDGKIPLLKKEMRPLQAMKKRFSSFIIETELKDIIEKSNPEVTIIWDENGNPMRGRLDLLADGLVIDYKTTTDADPIRFINKKIPELSYDIRASFYLRGIERLTGKPHQFIWIVQETEPPYACSIIGMGNELRQVADEKVEYSINKWSECLKNDDWGLYPNKIMWADPVGWDQNRFYEKLMMEGNEV